jgi:hypothetical protein
MKNQYVNIAAFCASCLAGAFVAAPPSAIAEDTTFHGATCVPNATASTFQLSTLGMENTGTLAAYAVCPVMSSTSFSAGNAVAAPPTAAATVSVADNTSSGNFVVQACVLDSTSSLSASCGATVSSSSTGVQQLAPAVTSWSGAGADYYFFLVLVPAKPAGGTASAIRGYQFHT